MATRRFSGITGWVAALALAALATGGWAVAQDSGNGGNGSADGSAPAAQQSQDQGPAAQRPRQRHGDGHRGWRADRGWNRGPAGRFGHGFMRRGASARDGMRLDAPMLMALRRLDLSDAQRERVRTVLLDARISALQALEKQPGAAAGRQQLAALLDPGDPNHARAVQALKDRAADRIERATQTQQALYDVLTPAQKTQLTQIFAQRRARTQQRGARRGAQPPGLHG